MTNDLDYQQIILRVFGQLRGREFNLGVGELLGALDLIDGGWEFDSPDRLRDDLWLLWRHSRARRDEFNEIWRGAVAAETPLPPPVKRDTGPLKPEEHKPERRPEAPPPAPESEAPKPPSPSVEATVLPTQTFATSRDETRGRINSYWPISRETMAHGWRYLWRPEPDGPVDVLDVAATIDRAARQGFFLRAVYRRRETNHAHLVLLVDQGGSMVPFHRFTRDLIETAMAERSLPRVEVYYFHNYFADRLHADPHLIEEIDREKALAETYAESSVVIVSDAGAARGYRRRERIRATTAMLRALGQRSSFITWLNPMPRWRWEGSSAEVIEHLAPMFQMDPDGFGSAIDVARGLPSQHVL